MKLTSWATRTLILGAVAGMVGCAGTSPVTTTPDTNVLPQNGDRQVLSAGEAQFDAASFEQMFNDLPKFISEEDAKSMLVEIDPSKIQTESGNYSVLQRRGGTWNRGDRGGHGFRSSGRGFHRSFGRGGSFSRFRFFNRGGFAFPYYYGLGGYYPYSFGGYYPYLYGGLGYGGLYSPYSYYNPYFTSSYYSPLWASSYLSSLYSWPGLPGASSVMQGGQAAQPAQQAAPATAQSTTTEDEDDDDDD